MTDDIKIELVNSIYDIILEQDKVKITDKIDISIVLVVQKSYDIFIYDLTTHPCTPTPYEKVSSKFTESVGKTLLTYVMALNYTQDDIIGFTISMQFPDAFVSLVEETQYMKLSSTRCIEFSDDRRVTETAMVEGGNTTIAEGDEMAETAMMPKSDEMTETTIAEGDEMAESSSDDAEMSTSIAKIVLDDH
jgi:hypothetical protein